MAVTAIRRLQERVLCQISDGTYIYAGTDKGQILKITIADGTRAVLKRVRGAKITGMDTDDTYLYAGDDRGRYHRVTIATAAQSTLESDLHSPIISVAHNTATRYLGLANGKTYSRA